MPKKLDPLNNKNNNNQMFDPSLENLEKISHVAQDAARLAGNEIIRKDPFLTASDDDDSGGGDSSTAATAPAAAAVASIKSATTDLVTETDQRCETIITHHITKHYPNHKIIGEETSGSSEYVLTNDPTWTIDPIDGTTNFVHSLQLSCILISFIFKKEVLVGVTYDPYKDELFYAIKGHGACLVTAATMTKKNKTKNEKETTTTTSNQRRKREDLEEEEEEEGGGGLVEATTAETTTTTFLKRRIHVSQATELSQAVISMDPGYGRDAVAVTKYCTIQSEILQRNVRNIRVFGCTGINMAYVACGRLDGGFEEGSWVTNCGPKIWDFACGKLLIEEAGGITQDIELDDDEETVDSKNHQSSSSTSKSLNLMKRSFFCAATPQLAIEMLSAIKQGRSKLK